MQCSVGRYTQAEWKHFPGLWLKEVCHIQEPENRAVMLKDMEEERSGKI